MFRDYSVFNETHDATNGKRLPIATQVFLFCAESPETCYAFSNLEQVLGKRYLKTEETLSVIIKPLMFLEDTGIRCATYHYHAVFTDRELISF